MVLRDEVVGIVVREHRVTLERGRAALARDGGACRVCGKAPTKPRYLHVHHIRPAYLFDGDWESANDLSNLVTLCATCHKGVESGRIPLAS